MVVEPTNTVCLRRIRRYRPRFLTLILFCAIAAIIALANFSCDYESRLGMFAKAVYGWPLPWHWHYVWITGIHSWDYSGLALAANLTFWTVMLLAPAAVCDWLLRRYRPRLRWSLRTMLAAMTLAALFCAWYAAAAQRANLQDQVVAESGAQVWIERQGPKWLDLLGAGGFRRRIVGVDNATEWVIDQSPRLPSLQALSLDWLSPEVVAALAKMPQLRMLRLELFSPPEGERKEVVRQFFDAIGRMTMLEDLYVQGNFQITVPRESLSCLTNLKRLKTLRLRDIRRGLDEHPQQPLLEHLGSLSGLEVVDLRGSELCDGDIARLAAQPRLKALHLAFTNIASASLLRLGRFPRLEELSIDATLMTPDNLTSLARSKRLRRLRIEPASVYHAGYAPLPSNADDSIFVPIADLHACQRAFALLREAQTEIVIDRSGQQVPFVPPGTRYDPRDEQFRVWLPATGMRWLTTAERTSLGPALKMQLSIP